jgi:GMP synthase (glutamine-hydrolysing)
MSEHVVLVIDNGGQWTHREWRVLRDLGCKTEIIPNTTPVEAIRADALVLSGGAPRISFEVPKLGRCGEYLDRFKGPILGICVGEQFMALHFGGTVGPAEVPEYGTAEIEVESEGDLFAGLPKKFVAWESHNDEVKAAPGFDVLARSKNCAVQAIRHRERPLYGVQFHPEVENTQFGYDIFKNFLKVCKR